LFVAAGLDRSAFVEDPEPRVLPTSFADVRKAWRRDDGLRVEAAFLEGQPVSFRAFEEEYADVAAYEPARSAPGGSGPVQVLRAALLVAAAVLAFRSLRSGRGDRVGTFRLAVAIFALVFAVTLLTGNHSAALGAEGRLLLRGMARGLLVAVQYAVFYLAIESHVRRIWPETLISWTRLLNGRFTDPLVAFNVLAGSALGVGAALALYVGRVSNGWLRGTESYPLIVRDRTLEVLHGPPQSLGALLEIVAYYADYGLAFVLGLVLFRFLLGGPWLAAIAMGVVQVVVWSLMVPEPTVLSIALLAAVAVAALYAAIRVGLLALMFGLFTFRLLTVFPLRTDLDHWFGGATIFAVGVTGGTVALSAWLSVRPRRG
jgi:hypothetical protein